MGWESERILQEAAEEAEWCGQDGTAFDFM